MDAGVDEQHAEVASVWRSLRRQPHWKCLVISVLIYGCLGAVAWCHLAEVTRVSLDFSHNPIVIRKRTSPCDEGYAYIPLAFLITLYLVYLVECWHCTTRLDLRAPIHLAEAEDRLQALRDATPVIWWKAICYHYVRRTRQVTRYRNGDAYTTTQVYYERVNSHTAGSSFVFTQCGIRDISKRLIDLDKFPATRFHLSKGFAFANEESAQEFEEQRARFFEDNERYDDYMEMREGLDLLNSNFRESILAFAEPIPWYVSQTSFWFVSAILLSWPLRLWLNANTSSVDYHITKLFGVNYAPCDGQTPSSTATDLEWTIRTNTTLIPSYSEALLIDARTPLARAHSSGNVTVSTALGPRHSWSATSARWAQLRTVPTSELRSSFHERPVYHAVPLGMPHGRWASTKPPAIPPPCYDVAVRVCRPLAELMERVIEQRVGEDDIPERNETAL